VENILYYANDGDDTTNGAYKPTIGFTSVIDSSRFVYNSQTGFGEIQENIVVLEVIENTFAQSMGLLSDDYIKAITINGKTTDIVRDYILSDLILTLRPGDTIALTVKRGEQVLTLPSITFLKSDFNVIE
jgi:C-terminal processing protease CtpA/Prc